MSGKYKRKFNYVYEIVNKKNNMKYIGVHKTDNLNDGYMGSGLRLLNEMQKYGEENFEKKILYFFDSYQEALQKEKEIVNMEFVKDENTYNLSVGGRHWEGGDSSMSERMGKSQKLRFKDENQKSILKEKAKERYADEDFCLMMGEKCWSNEERNKKIGDARKKWVEENSEKHKEIMEKVNKDPDKIKKTAETHTGMKRTEQARENISHGIKEYHANSEDGGAKRSGKGMRYIYNPETKKSKRISKCDPTPKGWVKGTGPKNTTNYKGMNKGSYFGHHKDTLQIKRFQKDDILPEGWIKGRP